MRLQIPKGKRARNYPLPDEKTLTLYRQTLIVSGPNISREWLVYYKHGAKTTFTSRRYVLMGFMMGMAFSRCRSPYEGTPFALPIGREDKFLAAAQKFYDMEWAKSKLSQPAREL